MIKLFNEYNLDSDIFKKLKKFYALRSTVVHGNDKLQDTTALPLIVYAENIVQKIIVRMIDLNKTHTYKAIDVALCESICISKTISELLEANHTHAVK